MTSTTKIIKDGESYVSLTLNDGELHVDHCYYGRRKAGHVPAPERGVAAPGVPAPLAT